MSDTFFTPVELWLEMVRKTGPEIILHEPYHLGNSKCASLDLIEHSAPLY